MKKLLLVVTLLLALTLLAGCGETNNNQVTPPAPDGKCAIVTEFDAQKGTISVVNSAGEAVTYCEKGEVVTITVTPAEGKQLSAFTINGKEMALNEKNQISLQVNGNFNVSASFGDVTVVYTRATDPILEERRQLADKVAREIAGTLFTYDKDYTYTLHGKSTTLKAGQLYRGLPYSNRGSSSVHAFLNASVGTDELGAYIIGGDAFAESAQWDYIYGNSCADLVYWAWSAFSNDFSFRWVEESTPLRGALPLGNWSYDKDKYGSTTDMCNQYGTEVIFDGYSQLLMGDAMLTHEPYPVGGHLILVTDNHIEYNRDGTINGDYSYVIYHDQNGYMDNCGVEIDGEFYEALSTTCLDTKSSYNSLFKKGYLPVTCEALLDPKYQVEEVKYEDSKAGSLNADAVLDGTITCNYYMSDLEMTITDEKGNVVQQVARISHERDHKSYDVADFGVPQVKEANTHLKLYPANDCIDVDALSAGKYHCTLIVYTIKGGEQVVRDFDFTV
ncbi:MAG: hypothetical protein J6K84_03665 [Oscillospiraceae bacterium]|nr:hypothetical protein [Oscillospiraceae bacterium]